MFGSRVRVLLGFLIAPGAPALLLYLINLQFVPRHDAEFGGVMLGILSYIAAIILGIPACLLARRWKLTGPLSFVVLGALVGLAVYVVFFGFLGISSYQSSPEHAIGLVKNSMM